ncbi:hypothetical protein F4Z99_07690 [Candidatus Poribacteria bacterium]|nr:hypothetical protein [Candidatus Poribacteria bacterium]
MALKKPNIVVYLSDDHGSEYLGNLAFTAETRPILEKMRADLRRWMQSQNDDGRHETCNPN